MKIYKYILITATLFTVFSCGKNDKQTDSFGKKEMFTNYADNLILPAYTNYGNALTSLQTALNDFNTAPDLTKLTTLQNAFLNTYDKWQYCEIYEKTEPANDAMAVENTNFFPTRIDSVNAYISRGQNSLAFVKSRIKIDKGLPAIDYLLFSKTGDNQQILNRFTTDVNADSYKAYLTSLVSSIKEIQVDIVSKWNTSYRQTFINSIGADAASSFSAMANTIAQRTDDLKRHQVGIPAGYSGNVPTIYTNPTAVQAYYSNNSISYLLLTLNNMKDVMYGRNTTTAIDGKGLYDYIKTLDIPSSFGGKLEDEIIAQIDVCIAKANECGPDLSNTIINDKPKADALFLQTKKLLILMKADLPSALGVTISYTDSDGD